MAVLNSWQKITRVIPGKPFGDARDGGSVTVNSDGNIRDTASGSATSTALTVGSAGTFGNGDIFVIHQTQGTGVGQWEVNRVASGGGSTSITCQVALHYTYGTGAQVINFGRFSEATLNSFNTTAWNGTTGGVYVLCAKSVIGSGTISAVGKGFTGGTGAQAEDESGRQANQGKGTVGVGTLSQSANGNGGGGGFHDGGYGTGGGGGGGGVAGSNGVGTAKGIGGSAVGQADLTEIDLGGGGGGAGYWTGTKPPNGANGGGIVIIFAKAITVSGAITLTGNTAADAADSYKGGAGGGAGGSALIVCSTATLGTNLVTALGGNTGGVAANAGGNGGVGRIAIHHSSTVSGTTNPTFTDVTDSSLIEKASSFLFNLV